MRKDLLFSILKKADIEDLCDYLPLMDDIELVMIYDKIIPLINKIKQT